MSAVGERGLAHADSGWRVMGDKDLCPGREAWLPAVDRKSYEAESGAHNSLTNGPVLPYR